MMKRPMHDVESAATVKGDEKPGAKREVIYVEKKVDDPPWWGILLVFGFLAALCYGGYMWGYYRARATAPSMACHDPKQVMGFKSDVSDVMTAAIHDMRAAADKLQSTLHASAKSLEGALPKSDMCFDTLASMREHYHSDTMFELPAGPNITRA